MGYVLSEPIKPDQLVCGVIAAQWLNKAIENALLVNLSIELWLAQAQPILLSRWHS